MQIKIIQLTLTIIFSFSIIILGYIVYQQQIFISSIKGWVQLHNNTGSSFVYQDNQSLNESNINRIIENHKNIIGTITAMTGNILTVDSQIDDFSSSETIDTSKPFNISLVKKTYTVKATSSTIFKGKELAELKVSDMLNISSSSSVITSDSFNALKIEYLDASKFNVSILQ